MANGSSSEFDAGWAAGKKRAKKDARAEKDLWAIRENLSTTSDYDLGFSVGYEIVAKDMMGPKGGVPVGNYGWLTGKTNYIRFTPRGGGFASTFTGPYAVENVRNHLRNGRNIPTKDIDAALNSFRQHPWTTAGGKKRHGLAALTADVRRALKK